MKSSSRHKPVRLYLPDIVGRGYRDFWNCKTRYRVVKGSRGSKKSKTAALNRIYRMYQYPEANILCVRRYQNTLRDSMYADTLWAIHRFGLDENFSWTVSPMCITRKQTGQKILFRGLDEGTKVTSIDTDVGYLCFVDIDEAYEIREDDFNKLDLSIRGALPEGYFKQITLLFNPWSATSWLKPRFFDSENPRVFARTTTWKCNEWLDDSDRELFEDMKVRNPRRYRIEGEGEWGIAEGLIYERTRMEEFDTDELRKKRGMVAAFGLDFGYTDPNALICMLIDNTDYKIYVFDEWYQRGVTNREIARAITEMGYSGQRIVCDSAEPKSIKELQREGIRHAEAAIKGKDSVTYGIQKLQNYEIIVHPRCKEFWVEITNYCWGKDRNGNPTDKPDHEFSHGPDAMRYGAGNALRPSGLSVLK